MNRATPKNQDLPVKKVGDITAPLTCVLYGRSGSGKTTLAASFPKPILYLDVRDEGTASISDVEEIYVREISSFEEFEETWEWLDRNPKKYKTIVIDTVSQLQQMVVEETYAAKKKKTNKAGDWGSMTKGDWGDVAAVLKEWLVKYRDLSEHKMNIVFIAQDRVFQAEEDEDEIGTIAPEVGPALSPSVAKVLNAAVSMIGNTFVRARTVKKKVEGKIKTTEKIEYCLRVGPNPSYITKLRKPKSVVLPEFLVDPTYEDILEVIKGEV